MFRRLACRTNVARPATRLQSVIGRNAYSTQTKLDEAVETVETVEENHKEVDEDQAVEDMMRRLSQRPVDASNHIELSPEVEAELNREFKRTVKEFALEADMTHEVLKHVERTAVQGARHTTTNKTTKSKDDGNVRGDVHQFPNVVRSARSEPYTAQELYMRRLFHAKNTTKLGSALSNVYRPHNDTLRPPSVHETSVSTLLAAGAHLGHSKALFRPSTQPYIYGIRDGIHIINLDQTLVHLRRASKVVQGVSEKGGLIVFLGTRPGQERSLQLAAKRAGGYYVHSRWVPGTLSNATEISSSWDRVEVDMGDEPTGRELSPNLAKTIVKPDLMVILNPVENRNAIRECVAAKIPTIGIIDTDSEPSLVSYPIPANDDSLRATDLLVGVLSRAAEKGRATRHVKFNTFKSGSVDAAHGDASNFNSV